MILTDIVQIVADNTNVYSGRLGEQIPPWAKSVRFQLISSDTDWTFSLSMGGKEYARDSAAHRTSADNAQAPDWRSPFCQAEIPRGITAFEILANVNVVTAGVGLAALVYSS